MIARFMRKERGVCGDEFFNLLHAVDNDFLVARAIDGDTEAYEVLLRRYAPEMCSYARLLLLDAALAQYVVQDAFLAVWRELQESQGLEGAEGFKRCLLRSIGRKAVGCGEVLLEHGVSLEGGNDVDQRRYEHTLFGSEKEKHTLVQIIRRLPNAQRICWLFRELGQYSYEEIAYECNLSMSEVKSLINSARKSIIFQLY